MDPKSAAVELPETIPERADKLSIQKEARQLESISGSNMRAKTGPNASMTAIWFLRSFRMFEKFGGTSKTHPRLMLSVGSVMMKQIRDVGAPESSSSNKASDVTMT